MPCLSKGKGERWTSPPSIQEYEFSCGGRTTVASASQSATQARQSQAVSRGSGDAGTRYRARLALRKCKLGKMQLVFGPRRSRRAPNAYWYMVTRSPHSYIARLFVWRRFFGNSATLRVSMALCAGRSTSLLGFAHQQVSLSDWHSKLLFDMNNL